MIRAVNRRIDANWLLILDAFEIHRKSQHPSYNIQLDSVSKECKSNKNEIKKMKSELILLKKLLLKEFQAENKLDVSDVQISDIATNSSISDIFNFMEIKEDDSKSIKPNLSKVSKLKTKKKK